MSSEMEARELAVYNNKNRLMLAFARGTWVNLVSSPFPCFQWDIEQPGSMSQKWAILPWPTSVAQS